VIVNILKELAHLLAGPVLKNRQGTGPIPKKPQKKAKEKIQKTVGDAVSVTRLCHGIFPWPFLAVTVDLFGSAHHV